MYRYLIGFVFGIALLVAAGTASALTTPHGEVPSRGHEGRPGSIVIGFDERVAPPTELTRERPPFEWPQIGRSDEPQAWRGESPFFSHFPLAAYGDLHSQRPEGSLGNPVPEPTTALLFGTGLLGLGLMRRRQR